MEVYSRLAVNLVRTLVSPTSTFSGAPSSSWVAGAGKHSSRVSARNGWETVVL
jgi:hypothetical protein